MKKLHFLALLWAFYFICATTVAVNTILWLPAKLLGVGIGLGCLAVLLTAITAGIDCTND